MVGILKLILEESGKLWMDFLFFLEKTDLVFMFEKYK